MLADYEKLDYGSGCQYYSYKIKGVGVNHPELRFNILSLSDTRVCWTRVPNLVWSRLKGLFRK